MVLAASILLLAGGVVIAPVGTPEAWAAEPSRTPTLKQISNRVDDHYNHLHSLRVQFTETYQGMGMHRVERGTMLLAKPGRMRWTYSQPPGKLFVIGEKYGYSYTPGDAQAERYPVKKLNDLRSPLRFLLGKTKIQKELDHLTMTREGSDYRLQGTPKGMEQRVSEVVVTVTPGGTIQTLEWKEHDGTVTRFDLSDEQPNPPIPQRAFQFTPPAGIVVVSGLTPM